MKRMLAVILCAVIPALAGDNGYNVKYDGGSASEVKPGADLRLYIDESRVRFTKDKKNVLEIPASSITEISYGQDVHRRVGAAIGIGVGALGIGALMALTKSKKHFVGGTWTGDQKGGIAMQCDKKEYRGILAGLEGISGKKAVNTDTMSVKN